MFDVPGLLHPGHPESADDRPEQPGDGQEHPARVCLHPVGGTHRHITAAGPLITRLLAPHLLPPSLLSISTLCHDHESIYKHLPAGFEGPIGRIKAELGSLWCV